MRHSNLPGADRASKVRGHNFNNIWQSFSLRVHHCKRDEVYFTAGAQPALHFGGGNFHEISFDDVIVLIQPWYNFSQTVTYNNNVFLSADTNSIAYKHTHSAQRWLIKNSVGGWITSVKRNFWLHAICACTEQHSTYKIRWENWWLGLRVWCLGKCAGLGFMLQLEKEI